MLRNSGLGNRPRLYSSAILGATLALAGCAGQAPAPALNTGLPTALGALPPVTVPGAPATGKTTGNILLLLPLTGSLAPAGQALANAAKLAVPDGGAPSLDIRDTGGTAQGATAAAQAGIAAGDGLILGPLTSAEAHAVMPLAQAAGVNMLAFTNDGTVAAPGVWALGITPTEQVQRVMQAAQDAGRTQLAALLPSDDFGQRLATALTAEAATLGEPAPQITLYQAGDFNSINQAADQVADFADRGQAIADKIKAAKEQDTAAGNAQAAQLAHQQIPPPSFNALFIGAIDPSTLAELANFLPYYDVNPPGVQFLGPANWADIAPEMAHQSAYLGAMYAAPDPAAATAFDAKYTAAYGAPPPAIANIGFDAAAIAALAAKSGGYTTQVLAAPAGFTGTDGVLVLGADGSVQRGLAVFQVAPSAPAIASPAPAQLAAPPAS